MGLQLNWINSFQRVLNQAADVTYQNVREDVGKGFRERTEWRQKQNIQEKCSLEILLKPCISPSIKGFVTSAPTGAQEDEKETSRP